MQCIRHRTYSIDDRQQMQVLGRVFHDIGSVVLHAGHRTAVPNVYMPGRGDLARHGINRGSGYIVAQELLAADRHPTMAGD